MAYNFSANQFEREFKPKRLGNWEVPKWYPERPRAPRKTPTRIIVNERGHLLPGIPKSTLSPWGCHYVGTWDLPKKISRHVATELSGPCPGQLSAWERRSAHVPFARAPDPSQTALPLAPEEQSVEPVMAHRERPKTHRASKEGYLLRPPQHNGGTPMRAKSSPHLASPEQLEITGHAPSRSASSSSRGSSSPRRHRTNRYTPGEIYKQDLPKPLVPPATPPNVPGYHSPLPKREHKRVNPPTGPPLIDAYSNFVVAKQFHQGNLQHQPLPDTVDDAMYRKLQAQGAKNPGLALDVDSKAAAVGWRGYGAPGPTQCSKLRVYRPNHRPKTAGVIPDIEGPDPPTPGRPSTSVKRTKLHRQHRITDMELAICWDLQPGEGMEEPKPTTHIDGSNGSAAPAVFTVVHQQPQPDCLKMDPPAPVNPPKKMSVDSFKSLTPNSAGKLRANPKMAWNEEGPEELSTKLEKLANGNQENHSPNVQTHHHRHSERRSGSVDRRSGDKGNSIDSSGIDSLTLAKRKHYRSSPNLVAEHNSHEHHKNNNLPSVKNKSMNCRPCVACELKTPPPDPATLLRRPKSEYKMAFKAGKPSNSFDSGSGPNTRPTTGKPVKVPKPKQFTKRSYSIDTLAPPFSLWQGNNASNQDYPEHWRLASVYQHAYKPVEARRKPLLASVYQ